MSNSNFWQLVFNQSKVNGAEYFGDRLPSNSWDWPKDTFLQKRMNELKRRRPESMTEAPQRNRGAISSPNRKRRHTHLRTPEAMACTEGH